MGKIYSHSRLSTFEQCPFKFKLRYIDKVYPEVEKTIEAHLGSAVHDVLEWLYNSLKSGKTPELEEVLVYYTKKWKETYDPKIIFVRKELTEQDYFQKGVRFIIDYYKRETPLEKKVEDIGKWVIEDKKKYDIKEKLISELINLGLISEAEINELLYLIIELSILLSRWKRLEWSPYPLSL